MDSNRIAKLAQGARDALRKDISNSLDRVLKPESAERLAFPEDVARVERLAKADPDALVERVAYTWFNRFCALRFMDARGYTPVGCVTRRPGESLPAILADARQGILHPEFPLSQVNRQRVLSLLDGGMPAQDPLGEAYTLLLLSACDAYRDSMGYLFGGSLEERSAIRLLHPTNLTAEDGVLAHIVAGMDDEACKSVEVLGWLYQFYIAERRKEWNESKDKAKSKDIAPATQLFTPNYIVRFLAENSLGRLWMLNNPDSGLAAQMDYYIAPQKGEEGTFIEVDGPEDIMVCDPACGSGHILVYAFDLLFQMYQEEGYLDAEIPGLILENNLYGMEIDPRAAEIASFALEMKAREKDPDFFRRDVDPHITVLEPITFAAKEIQGTTLADNHALLDAFKHLTECGSLYVPKPEDLQDVEDAIKAVGSGGDLFTTDTLNKLAAMRDDLKALGKRYSCVIANPPYMGSKKFDAWTSAWVKDNYPDEKNGLCTCFMHRSLGYSKHNGYAAMITASSWMFISSFEKMRRNIIDNATIISMVQLSTHGFPNVTVPTCMWVISPDRQDNKGSYIRLEDFDRPQWQQPKTLEAIHNPDCGWFYRADQRDFKSIPGWPIAYWASEAMLEEFKKAGTLADIACPRQGLVTGNNERFLRLWWEVCQKSFGRDCENRARALLSRCKWFPCNKGGEFRKWYGNNAYVVNWEDDGEEIRSFKKNGRLASRPQNMDYYFHEGLTWSALSSGSFAMRFSPKGYISEHKGTMCFAGDRASHLTVLGTMNSSTAMAFLTVLCPTLDFGEGAVGKVPVEEADQDDIAIQVNTNISLCKTDWDSFETSWDFTTHPLCQPGEPLIEKQFARWSSECQERFDTLKANEEELNRIFARIYHMEGEVPIEVPDDKVSVRLADELRDVQSLISYGIGCIFGRYSTDKPGLILADADQTAEDYRAKVPQSGFAIDEDAVLPVIGLEDVSLDDDVVRRFRNWLAYAYGSDTLDANVSYIEGVLGKDLRTYFAKDFYKDHCNTYSVQGSGKRPIYWMFSSPRGSFQALVYMHRMNRDTVSCVLTEYVRPFRQRLIAQIGVLRATGAARDASKADKYQAMVDELEGWERDVLYPLSQKHVQIDLDDGVRHNYKLFRTDGGDALAKVSGLS
ncbi:MAG: BREX-1 system adenine-specific DNA-methyltransferase PglX [Atopobium sp.]|nr:BREX-1 system adenine-specific DNA-methyltransferase PglX [Atopobium sp.]RRF98623.1 MAG: BREX-1 system adenine-specific DNA-methyltransferase PglX [Coriobacteriaceae bacterium]